MAENHGKTVARIEEKPPSELGGSPDPSTVLIHFTDGTALEIQSSSYEEADQCVSTLSADEIARRQALGRSYQHRQERRASKRREWMALTCEERAACIGQPPPIAVEMRKNLYGQIFSLNKLGYGDKDAAILRWCDKCYETECPNAKEQG